MKPLYKVLILNILIILVFLFITQNFIGMYEGIVLGIFMSLTIDATYIIDEMYTIYRIILVDSLIILIVTFITIIITGNILGSIALGVSCACSINIVYIIEEFLRMS